MEESFLEFELDFFRNFFSTACDDENDFNNVTVSHQKSVLSPYSIGVCLYYLISMIKSDKIREKVANELIGIELNDFQKQENTNIQEINVDSSNFLIKEIFKLISKVEDQKSSFSSENSKNSFNKNGKRKFYSANLVFSIIDPNLLSPESELFQSIEFIKHVEYTSNPVYKVINKTVKKLTFGHIQNLMNPLMHFTDNSLALSSLLYFEDNFHEDNCFDSVEVHIFHTFSASSRRRKSSMAAQKSIKCQYNENKNICLSCQKNDQKLMSSSQSFTSLYQYSVSSVKVQMMRMTGKSPLCNDKSKNYFAIELPTNDKKFSLVCVIPRYRGEDAFTNMIQSMTSKEYRSILDNMEPLPYDICLPFFSFDTESFDLISPLTEFEADKIYLYNNELSCKNHIEIIEEDHKSDQKDSKKKKKKKTKKDKKKKEKEKKKKSSSLEKLSIDEENNDEELKDSKNDDVINNENGNSNYFYCPHCGARKLKNESMIGQECMIKNIKLNEDAFLHHFRQKCNFSVNLNGIGQNLSSGSIPRSNSISSWSSSSSLSSHSNFESNIKADLNSNIDKEKSISKELKSKGKEKKKKDNQTKKIFDHPFIFFLTRRNPDIIIQYGVVTVPTLQDESFVSV